MISIVIPTFNRAGFVIQAVESVLSQTFENLELIVIDDGSTDSTERQLAQINDSRLRYQRIDHSGVSRARNAGIGLCRYDWISFLDSDDLWMPEKLEEQVEFMRRNRLYQVAYTNEIWIRNGERVNQRKKHRKYGGWIYHRCLALCIISPSSVLIHRSVLQNEGVFDPDLPVCEDYDLWLRISARNPILFVDKPLITKRGGHPDQLSKSRWGFDRFRVKAMLKCAESGRLTYQQFLWTAREIVTKSKILLAGFEKRGKENEARYYREIIDRFEAR